MLVESARDRGQDVAFDMHTRTFGLTNLYAALPAWALAAGTEELQSILRDPAQRDTMRFDGQSTLPGVPPRGAGVSSSKLKLSADAQRSVTAEFDGERLAGLSWPLAQGHVSVLELTY